VSGARGAVTAGAHFHLRAATRPSRRSCDSWASTKPSRLLFVRSAAAARAEEIRASRQLVYKTEHTFGTYEGAGLTPEEIERCGAPWLLPPGLRSY